MDESELREYINELVLDDLDAAEADLSLDFVREFKDQINWKYIFDTKYIYYQYDIVIGNEGVNWKDHIEPKSFKDWMKEYNYQLYKEFYKDE